MTSVDPRSITRPDPALHTYYVITSLFGLFLFPLLYIPGWFKYKTLRYRFDDEGVAMSWGRFFEQETYLNYRRIQDIQVSSGVIQRRLGLADLKLQTASAGTGAEMTIVGIRNPEQLRDFLYERMRGAVQDEQGEDGGAGHASPGRADGGGDGRAAGGAVADAGNGADDEVLGLLLEIRDGLRKVNEGRDA